MNAKAMRFAPLTAVLLLATCSTEEQIQDVDIHTVKRGDLRITVREQGELHATVNTRIASQVKGRATLIYLIQEGAMVQKGDRLAELDVSGVEDKLANQSIAVAKAEAALEQGIKNFEIVETIARQPEYAAESQVRMAHMRLEGFLGRTMTTERPADREIAGTNAEMVAKLKERLGSPS